MSRASRTTPTPTVAVSRPPSLSLPLTHIHTLFILYLPAHKHTHTHTVRANSNSKLESPQRAHTSTEDAQSSECVISITEHVQIFLTWIQNCIRIHTVIVSYVD